MMGSFWAADKDGLQQSLVVGHPSADNPHIMLSLISGAIRLGAGALILDRTADSAQASMCGHIVRMVEGHRRVQDLDILHMRMPVDDAISSVQRTFNPFADASPEVVTRLAVEMLTLNDGSTTGQLWKGRASSYVLAVAKAICLMRDSGRLDLTPVALRDHLSFKRLVEMWDGSLYPDLPGEIRRNLGVYLCSLPGFQENRGVEQFQITLDQHGYMEMQFMKALQTLIENLGHIFLTTAPDLKMVDVVRDRRILVVRLPSEWWVAESAGRLVMSAYQRAVDQFRPRVAT